MHACPFSAWLVLLNIRQAYVGKVILYIRWKQVQNNYKNLFVLPYSVMVELYHDQENSNS